MFPDIMPVDMGMTAELVMEADPDIADIVILGMVALAIMVPVMFAIIEEPMDLAEEASIADVVVARLTTGDAETAATRADAMTKPFIVFGGM